jgi:phospholipid transport system substrate-binding protein
MPKAANWWRPEQPDDGVHAGSGRHRCGLLISAAVFFLAMAQPTPHAETEVDGALFAPLNALDDALIAVMRSGDGASFLARSQAPAPIVERAFDLDVVLAAAFRRYTVANYVENFDTYNSQSSLFCGRRAPLATVGPARSGAGQSRLCHAATAAGWRAVDVLTNRSISRVAVQRSDFRQLLDSGGVAALTSGLDRKFADLPGGPPD